MDAFFRVALIAHRFVKHKQHCDKKMFENLIENIVSI